MRRGRVIGSILPDDARRGLVSRYVAGEHAPSIAAEVGVTAETIRRWVREAGEVVRSKKQAKRLRDRPIMERFMDKMVVSDSGCWDWVANRNPDGYALFRSPGEQRAHRFAYRQFVGPIPDGCEIDHLCGNRGCVNPAHLDAVPHRVNVARSKNHNRHKTHCKRGHPFEGANLRIIDGKRQCRECINLRQRHEWTRRAC